MMKSHPKGREITTVDCSISAGMFKSERMVSVELPGGHEVTALVDRHQVIPDREVSPNQEYKGQVKVTVLQVKNNSAIIVWPLTRIDPPLLTRIDPLKLRSSSATVLAG